uniref:Uncharacterized protein n=1 Tax=Oryza brachyantha TaxID=4533 RepID=J3MDZ1_ORYBR
MSLIVLSTDVLTHLFNDNKINGTRKREESQRSRMRKYRSQLEQEVKKLKRQLEEEIDLHVGLVDAVTQNAAPEVFCEDSTYDCIYIKYLHMPICRIGFAHSKVHIRNLHSNLIRILISWIYLHFSLNN